MTITPATIDSTLSLFLKFGHGTTLTLLIGFGYLFINRPLFSQALRLLFLSIILNYALKVTFQVPLNPALGKEGFAFPSGHMQCATVIYGRILGSVWQNVILSTALLCVLVGLGLALVHFGYHCYMDVFAGFVCGFTLLISSWVLSTRHKTIDPDCVWAALGAVLILYIHCAHGMIERIWMAYFSLLSIMISEGIMRNKQKSLTFPEKHQ